MFVLLQNLRLQVMNSIDCK